MLLTLDIYSGRPNPTWRLTPIVGKLVFEAIADLIDDPKKLPSLNSRPRPDWLGYRGLKLHLSGELMQKYRLPPYLSVPAHVAIGVASLFQEFLAIVQTNQFHKAEGFDAITRKIIQATRATATKAPPLALTKAPITGPCGFEMVPFDPKPWNDPAFQPTNNCYAYASNKRSNYPHKPQPGIGSGKKYTIHSMKDVSAAAKRDGAHDSNDCFNDTEAPRMLVALVIWPGPDDQTGDYHWYRKHPDCWGHKPGGTPARNVDNSSAKITNPETCDRGPYTEFYGYMLLPKSLKIAANP